MGSVNTKVLTGSQRAWGKSEHMSPPDPSLAATGLKAGHSLPCRRLPAESLNPRENDRLVNGDRLVTHGDKV